MNTQLLNTDEPLLVVSYAKFAKTSFEDFVSFIPVVPPFCRIVLGVASFFIEADYSILEHLEPMSYTSLFYASDLISKNFIPMRYIIAFAGILSLLFIYLATKELFNKNIALWSTALSAISVDLIFYSRILFQSSLILLFSLGTIFFFIKYVKKQKYLYLGLVYLFLFFALGSHTIQPLPLIPLLIISQFMYNKGFLKNLLISVGYVSTYFLMLLIYLSNLNVSISSAFGFIYAGSSNIKDVFLSKLSQVSFHKIIFGFLLRNNYVLGLVSLICIFLAFKYRFKIFSKDLKLILIILFIISFL